MSTPGRNGSWWTALAASLLAVAPVGAAERGPSEEPEWRLQLGLTGQYEYYDVTGDKSQGLYPHEGSQPSGQLDLEYSYRFTPYRSLRARLLGLVNDSSYRSPYDGLVPQRMSLVYQDGQWALPLRAELGDYLAWFSQRTLDRPLKGAAVELQGELGSPQRHWSLVALTGGYRESYRDFEIGEDWTSGLSWLLADPVLGTLTLHFADTQRSRDPRSLRRLVDQRLYGIAWAKQLLSGDLGVVIEGEYDHIEEREVDADGNDLTEMEGDDGWFAQLRGEGSSPLSFRLRYEEYGQDYRPTGSPLTIPDRRSAEGHLAWRFGSGLEIRGRVQGFKDDKETDNPLDTLTVGGTVSGPLVGGAGGLNGWVDFYYQDAETDDQFIAESAATLNADLWHGTRSWMPRLTFFWQDYQDDGIRQLERSTLQLQARSEGPFEIASLRGTLGPGLLYRNIDGGLETSEDWWPTFVLSLGQGIHRIEAALDWQRQDRGREIGIDVDTLNYRLLYRLGARRDWVDVEFNAQAREPERGEDTESYRASVLWTHRFSAGSPLERAVARGRVVRTLPEGRIGPVDLTELVPGLAVTGAERRMAAAGAPEPSRDGDIRVYETRLFPQIDARQRLVLIEREGLLEKAALIVEPPRGSGAREATETFERLRALLVERWGRPASTYNQGEAGADLVDAVNRGDFVRIAEWLRAEGMLRLGIPRRVDGQVRIEIQFAEGFPALRDTLWSVEAVR